MPWQDEDGGPRLCERSLSLAILYQLCPQNRVENSISTLEKLPESLGRLYPANGIWTLWALARAERMDAVFNDFETRWLKMDSVDQNNTMQEAWKANPDSNSQWSHASIGPLISIYMDIAGIRPTSPGFRTFMVKPQLGPVEQLELTNYSPQGPINFKMEGKLGKRRLEISVPPNSQGLLVVDQAEKIKLPTETSYQESNKKAYKLSGGQSFKIPLKYT